MRTKKNIGTILPNPIVRAKEGNIFGDGIRKEVKKSTKISPLERSIILLIILG